MAAVLAERSPGVHAIGGRGEAIPLRDASADGVFIASAWHWLDAGLAVPEIARVLRDGGRLGVISTSRDPGVEWVRELGWPATAAAGDAGRPERHRRRHHDVTLPPDASFTGAGTASFTFIRPMTISAITGMLATYSGIITAGPAARWPPWPTPGSSSTGISPAPARSTCRCGPGAGALTGPPGLPPAHSSPGSGMPPAPHRRRSAELMGETDDRPIPAGDRLRRSGPAGPLLGRRFGLCAGAAPAGFATWNDYWRDVGVPEADLGTGADCIIDPDGGGPRIWFQVVPETKSVKNRLHLDIHASGGRAVPIGTRRQRVDAEARRLSDLGATMVGILAEEGLDHYAVAMKDPEGNEFDIN